MSGSRTIQMVHRLCFRLSPISSVRGISGRWSLRRVALLGLVPALLSSCGDSSDSSPAEPGAYSDAAAEGIDGSPDVGIDGSPDGDFDGSQTADAEADAADGGDEDGVGTIVAPTQTMYATTDGDIHMPCHGSGPLAVVFLAGGTDNWKIWNNLIAQLGPDVLTCRFDRPGVPPSYTPSTMLTPQIVAAALAETLSQAAIGPRVVLVGHSLGGLSTRVFGGMHADVIAGAVFLDPTVPVFADLNPTELTNLGWDPVATKDQGDAVTSWDSDVNLVVLSHDPDIAVTSGGWTAENQALWDDGQLVYAGLTPNGTQTNVVGANHYVFQTAPAVVVAAIQDALAAAQ